MTSQRRLRKQTKRAGQERPHQLSKTQTITVQYRPRTTPKDIEQQLLGLDQKAKTLLKTCVGINTRILSTA